MNIWYILQVPGWLIIFLTAAFRINAIEMTQNTFIWWLRRISLVASATIAVMMVASPFTESTYRFSDPTWRGFMISFAWAMTWITSPNQRPWWLWLSGYYRQLMKAEDAKLAVPPRRTMGGRITGEMRGLGKSFQERDHGKKS